MEKILDIITEKMERAFADAGYDTSYGRVTVSNRPDLCEYQCNGALAAAKQYHCAPIQIAKAVAEKLDAADYSLVEAVMPGFINLKLSGAFLETYLEAMRTAPDFGVAKTGAGKTIVVDYGQRGEAPAHRSSAPRHHRRSHEAAVCLLRLQHHRRRASGRLGPANGSDHRGAARPSAEPPLL